MRFRWQTFFLIIGAILLIGLLAFGIWAANPRGPMPEALAALESDDRVIVKTDSWLTFTPHNMTPTTGFILYPGGRVDARSYAPPANAIAEAGYFVVIPPMSLSLAVLNPDAATDVIAAHPEIERWAIGGHSLGGAMAADYVYKQSDATEGLILWASYPPESVDLRDREELITLSIYGTEESGAEKMQAAAAVLPPNTEWVAIEGGNHAQFGWYGDDESNPATISRAEQQTQIIDATVAILNDIEMR